MGAIPHTDAGHPPLPQTLPEAHHSDHAELMSRPNHDEWTRLHALALALHRATNMAALFDLLQSHLPSLLAKPCLVVGDSMKTSSLAQTGNSTRIPLGPVELHLERSPDHRTRKLLRLVADHLEIVVPRLRRTSVDGCGGFDTSALTPRQKEILPHLLRGRSNAEIAYDLGISIRTLEKHNSAIMRHFGVASRVELISAFYLPTSPGTRT